MHKIVILDGYALNPGDLSWDGIATFGDLTVHDRTPEEMIVDNIGDADLVFTNKTMLTRDVLKRCPNMRYLGLLSTGKNSVDAKAAKEFGIAVTNVPAYSTEAVAQLTFALLLELCHHVGLHSKSVQRGDWIKNPNFCYWLTEQIELTGKTIGIVGMGQIGQAVARLSIAFGMKVLYSSRTPKELTVPAEHCTLDQLLSTADIVTLHCPLTEETAGIASAAHIAQMKDGAILLNTARGPLVDEQAVSDALKSGKLSGFGSDVSAVEPMLPTSPLLGAPNCVITPHIAWASHAARTRLLNIAAENLAAFLRGEQLNRVV